MLLEELGILLRGIILGIAIAAPVGPTGLLCIRRTVERGMPAGLATGLGAAVADALFSSVAAFGLTAVLDMIRGNGSALQLAGGLFLLGVAVHSFMRDPKPPEAVPEARNLIGAVGSGFLLTASNPVTIMGMITLVLGLGGVETPLGAATLVAGIFIGSGLWWMALCGGVSLVRRHFTGTTIHWLNRGTGAVLGCLGLWALADAVLRVSGPA